MYNGEGKKSARMFILLFFESALPRDVNLFKEVPHQKRFNLRKKKGGGGIKSRHRNHFSISKNTQPLQFYPGPAEMIPALFSVVPPNDLLVLDARARTLAPVSEKTAFLRDIKSKEVGCLNPFSHSQQPCSSALKTLHFLSVIIRFYFIIYTSPFIHKFTSSLNAKLLLNN